MIDAKLMAVLACPCCKGGLEPVGDKDNTEGLACNSCALVYPVDGGIPVMLTEEAISRLEWNSGSRKKHKG